MAALPPSLPPLPHARFFLSVSRYLLERVLGLLSARAVGALKGMAGVLGPEKASWRSAVTLAHVLAMGDFGHQ